LLDTPDELLVELVEEHVMQHLVKLGEHVDDGVQRMVTRCRHPLRLLQNNTEIMLKWGEVGGSFCFIVFCCVQY